MIDPERRLAASVKAAAARRLACLQRPNHDPRHWPGVFLFPLRLQGEYYRLEPSTESLPCRILAAAIPALVCLAFSLPASADDPAKLTIPALKRTEVKQFATTTDPATGVTTQTETTKITPTKLEVAIEPKKTAVVVCDMWDDHWCKNAAKRCGELAKQMEPILKSCREKGMTIIHCPSDTMEFYKDHPARKRAASREEGRPSERKRPTQPATTGR